MLLGLSPSCAAIGVIESTPWTAASYYVVRLLAMAMIGFLTVIPVELLADEQVAVPLEPATLAGLRARSLEEWQGICGYRASTSAAATSVRLDEIIGGDKVSPDVVAEVPTRGEETGAAGQATGFRVGSSVVRCRWS